MQGNRVVIFYDGCDSQQDTIKNRTYLGADILSLGIPLPSVVLVTLFR